MQYRPDLPVDLRICHDCLWLLQFYVHTFPWTPSNINIKIVKNSNNDNDNGNDHDHDHDQDENDNNNANNNDNLNDNANDDKLINITSRCDTIIAACSSNTCIKSFKIRKWNVGVIKRRLVFHFDPPLKQDKYQIKVFFFSASYFTITNTSGLH